MKYLTLKFLIVSLLFLLTNFSFGNEKLPLPNIIMNKNPILLNKIVFQDINEKDINLEDYKGNIIILNFWATWCLPCKEEMLSLDKLQINKNFKNIIIFPINVGQENKIKAKTFFLEFNIKNLDIFYEKNIKLTNEFNLRGLPTTIFINKEYKAVAQAIGSIDFENKEFLEWLKKIN